MPFIPVPNTVQVNVVYLMDDQEVENTLYYEKSTGVDATDLASLVETLNAFIVSELIPFLGNTIQLIRLVGVLLDAADSLLYVSTTGLPVSGGAAGAAAPNNVALCMSLRTGTRGRSFRGRNFIPGIPKDLITENTVGSGSVTAYEEAYNGLIGVAGDDGWQQVVVSRFSGGAPRVTGVTTPITAAFVVDPTVDSQRRRLPGRGS